MDSSRSGLLSTLIMTIPLIVVPALALLRPPAPDSGTSSTRLDASSSEDEFFDEFAEIMDAAEGSSLTADREAPPWSTPAAPQDSDRRAPAVDPVDPFATMFDEPSVAARTPGPAAEPAPEKSDRNAAPPAAPSVPPPDRRSAATHGPAATHAGAEDDAGETPLLKQLRDLGATKTIWFAPGGDMTGFAAFLPGDKEHVSYRFEAICRSREECLRQVHGQVARWRDGHRPITGK